MDNDELRQRQLARLRGEVIEPIAGSALEFVPDAGLDADYASYCAGQNHWEKEAQPREVWETKHKESMQRYNIQPANSGRKRRSLCQSKIKLSAHVNCQQFDWRENFGHARLLAE